MAFVLERLAEMYGRPTWRPRRDGTAELVLTILSQHTSDLNAERAFDELRRRFPTWAAVEAADPTDLADAIRSGGLADAEGAADPGGPGRHPRGARRLRPGLPGRRGRRWRRGTG